MSEHHAAAGAIKILVALAATRYNDDIHALAAAVGHVSVCGPNTTRVCVDICGS